MKLKRIPLLSILLGALLLACAEKEAPNLDLTFTLFVENQTSRSVDVYLNSVLDDEGFVLGGTAFSNEILEIPELVINSQYRMRLVNTGRPVSEFFQERSFAQVDAAADSLLIPILD
ncbi:hypothetical protein [Algoriphagus namhaensis]